MRSNYRMGGGSHVVYPRGDRGLSGDMDDSSGEQRAEPCQAVRKTTSKAK